MTEARNRLLTRARAALRPRTTQHEMKQLQALFRLLQKLLPTDRILSERLCILLRHIRKFIDQRLEENDRALKRERREKEKIRKQIEQEEEKEQLRAKRNAAW